MMNTHKIEVGDLVRWTYPHNHPIPYGTLGIVRSIDKERYTPDWYALVEWLDVNTKDHEVINKDSWNTKFMEVIK